MNRAQLRKARKLEQENLDKLLPEMTERLRSDLQEWVGEDHELMQGLAINDLVWALAQDGSLLEQLERLVQMKQKQIANHHRI